MPFLQVITRKTRLLHFMTIGLIVASLMAGVLNPLFQSSQTAFAAQLTSRSVAISTSKISATATYVIAFNTPTPGPANIGSIVIQACTTPLSTCTAPAGMTMNVGTTGTWTGTSATNFTRTTVTTGNCTVATNQWCGARTAASEAAGAKTLTLAGLTNPSALGTFYLRITTYTDNIYTLGNLLDTGVVAGATTNQLTVNARIQEILNFCVGTTTVNDATTSPGADCTAISGVTVDIGVLDSGTINLSPVTTNGGTSNNGIAMVRTNAQSGVIISYFTEQVGGSGAFKVTTATCGSLTPVTGSTTDQCINSSPTQDVIVAGTEEFGMTIAGTNCGSTTSYTCVLTAGSNNLKASSPYIGATSTSYGTSAGFAWQDSATAITIATSAGSTSKVVDDEALILRFAATSGVTTPTGAYTTQSTYIATATF